MNSSLKIIFLIIVLVVTTTVNAQNNSIPFIENDYQLAFERSKTSNKIIFVMVYATWCSHCNKMKNTVLKDPVVTAFFSTNFINLMMDSDTEKGKEFMKKFNIKSFPSYIYLDKNETHLYSTAGEFSNENFIAEAKKALNPNTQLPFLEKQFNEDSSNSNKCFAYLSAIKKSIDADKSDVITATYLSTQTKDQLISPINWKIIAYGANDLSSIPFDLLLNHQSDFAIVSSPKRVETKIVSVVNKTLKQNISHLDTISYSKNRSIAKKAFLPKVDSLVFRYDLQMYEASKNWKNYQKTTQESVQKWAWNDSSTINQISKVYVDNINDKESLKATISWARKSTELNNSAESFLLLARLYKKVEDKKNAIENAKKAKGIIIEMGWDTKEINQLYSDLGI